MTPDDILAQLPNGMHDASISGMRVEFGRRTVTLEMQFWVGDLDAEDEARREVAGVGVNIDQVLRKTRERLNLSEAEVASTTGPGVCAVQAFPALRVPSKNRRMEPIAEVEPHEQGMLDVGDGQQIYWEVCGNPHGKPAVFLHGGPGSGCTSGSRRLFDPAKYRIVLFDQRNCGRSTPSAADAQTDLSGNTTRHLVADMELLREHLGIDRWVVFGGSWGVTLGLAYAEQHPERVAAAIFASVTMTRPADVHWLYHEVGRYFPQEWDRFRRGVPRAERDGDLVAAYDRLLNGQAELRLRESAAQHWCDWEAALISLEPGYTYPGRFADPRYRVTFARIVTHYFSHAAWLSDGQLLRDAHRLAGIPGVLVHGRLDLGSPADTAWQLAQAWPGSELHFTRTGHGMGDEMIERVRDAVARFAR